MQQDKFNLASQFDEDTDSVEGVVVVNGRLPPAPVDLDS